jgi:hypothetical protein
MRTMAAPISPSSYQGRRDKILRWILLVIALASVLTLIPVYSSTDYTCLHCRADKHERRFLGAPFCTVSDTEFTPWYRSRHPVHEHTWAWSGSSLSYTAYGTMIRSCGRRHPIFDLSPSLQRVLAERAPDALEAFYRGIDSPDRQKQLDAALSASSQAIDLR